MAKKTKREKRPVCDARYSLMAPSADVAQWKEAAAREKVSFSEFLRRAARRQVQQQLLQQREG